ncbi:MAG: hypothetical protein RL325_311, partial [Planctomycetota bacterium]
RAPDFDRIAAALPSRLVFDGRNLFKRSAMEARGFAYHSVGRAPVLAKP